MSGFSGFTPGPWAWNSDGNLLRPVNPDPHKHHVHTIIDQMSDAIFRGADWRIAAAEQESNRTLIAAAPTLFDAVAEAEAYLAIFEGSAEHPRASAVLGKLRDALSMVGMFKVGS